VPAVILDVDGTLVDSNDAHAHAWVEAFRESGIAAAFEDVRRAIGMGGDKLLPAVAGLDEESEPGKTIAKRRGEIFTDKYLSRIKPFPSVRELLERFARDGYSLTVASSAKEEELKPLLERAHASDLLAATTSSDDAEESKPDPDIVQAALKRVKCKPAEAIMLGDTPYDIEAARRAGVAIVALECGGWSAPDLSGAIEVYKDPADLLQHYDTSAFVLLEHRL
jgi:phosphoglycolate phosphatase-like HAD superfamily hydrolase